MLEKSIKLNIGIASNEFGKVTGLFFAGVALMFLTGMWALILAAANFAVSFVYAVKGFTKLYQRSLFHEEAYLYMTMPISHLNMILGKIVAATFWLIWPLAVGAGYWTMAVLGGTRSNISDIVITSAMMMGVKANQTGVLTFIIIWTFVAMLAMVCSTILTALIIANSMEKSHYGGVINFFFPILGVGLVIAACLCKNKIFQMLFDPKSNLFMVSILDFFTYIGIIAIQVYIAKILLDKKFNLT